MGREAENNWELEVFTVDDMNYWDEITKIPGPNLAS